MLHQRLVLSPAALKTSRLVSDSALCLRLIATHAFTVDGKIAQMQDFLRKVTLLMICFMGC